MQCGETLNEYSVQVAFYDHVNVRFRNLLGDPSPGRLLDAWTQLFALLHIPFEYTMGAVTKGLTADEQSALAKKPAESVMSMYGRWMECRSSGDVYGSITYRGRYYEMGSKKKQPGPAFSVKYYGFPRTETTWDKSFQDTIEQLVRNIFSQFVEIVEVSWSTTYEDGRE